MTLISILPGSQRPVEKVLAGDVHKLTNIELLAVILGAGIKGADVLSLAGELVKSFPDLDEMARASSTGLMHIRGMGKVKAAKVMAALEIGRRFGEQKITDKKFFIRSPADVAGVFGPRVKGINNEVFVCIFLNSKNRVLAVKEVARGTASSAMPEMRKIIFEALIVSATALICVHNHPSGDPEPSREDILFTSELSKITASVEIRLLDHVVLGAGSYVSLCERGAPPFSKDLKI